MPYRLPPLEQKSRYLRQGFDAIARRYDLFNDLITQGQHRRWKRVLVRELGLRPGQRVLDLCCGTGDIARRVRDRLGPAGLVVAADFSGNMLQLASARLSSSRAAPRAADAPHALLRADATRLPFRDGAFDALTIGYGLRNVDDLPVCLKELYRVLAPGGVLASLDVGKVRAAGLRVLANAYFFYVVPWIGWLIQPGQDLYSYLPHSSLDYPHQDQLKAMLAEHGFVDNRVLEFLGGASVIHLSRKPG